MPLQRFAALSFLFLSPLVSSAFGQALPTTTEAFRSTVGHTPMADDAGRGVVVEDLARDCQEEKSWPRTGDVLQSWSRGNERGDFDSPFDLDSLQFEQHSLGQVTLQGMGNGRERTWELGPTPWCFTARPAFSHTLYRGYVQADLLVKAGRVAAARRIWERMAVREARQHWLWAWLLYHGATLLEANKKWPGAVRLFEEANAATHLDPRINVLLLGFIAATYSQSGDPVRAADYYQRRLVKSKELGGESLFVADSLLRLGVFVRDRNPTEAIDDFRGAIAIQEKFAPLSLALAYSLQRAGELSAREGDLARAQSYYQRALSIQQTVAPEYSDTIVSLVFLGAISWLSGDLRKAEGYYRRSLSLERKWHSSDVYLALAINGLASLAWLRGELARAEYYEQRVLTLRQKSSPGSVEVGESLDELSGIYWAIGNLAKATNYNRRAVQILQRVAPDSLDLAQALSRKGSLLLASGQTQRAAALLRRALTINQKLAPAGASTASALADLGEFYSKLGDLPNAEKSYRSALAIWQPLGLGTNYSIDLADLAQIMQRKGHQNDAADLYEQALASFESQSARLGGSTEQPSVPTWLRHSRTFN